ncbi:uncharacterized protein LJ206_003161 [Theristicus caerulescens]
MFHISPHQRRDVIFPALFQQSLVNTVCGETRASPAFPRSRGGGEPGRGAGAGRTPCRGWGGGTGGQKQKPPDGSVGLAVVAVVLPGPPTLLPAGWELLLRVRRQRQGPFVAQAAVAARGAQGQPPAAASAGDLPAGGRRSKGDGALRLTPLRNRIEGGRGGTEVTWERGRRAARPAPRRQNRSLRRSGQSQTRVILPLRDLSELSIRKPIISFVLYLPYKMMHTGPSAFLLAVCPHGYIILMVQNHIKKM